MTIFKLDSFLFYKRNDSESDNSIYLAIKTSYNESSDNTEYTTMKVSHTILK